MSGSDDKRIDRGHVDLPLSEESPTLGEIVGSMWKWSVAGVVGGLLAPFAALLSTVGPFIPGFIIGVIVGGLGGAFLGYVLAYRKRQI